RVEQYGRRLCELGHAEVEDLYVAISPHHDVRRLNITVDYACGMSCSKGACQLDRDVQHLTQFHPWTLIADDTGARVFHVLKQRLTVDESRNEVLRRIKFSDLVNRNDVGVVQC